MLEKIENPDVRIYTVYMPILQMDREANVPSAMKQLPDKRVRFFWDSAGELAQNYSRILQLPRGQLAWDVYLLFNRDAEWKVGPPATDYWMHQLGRFSPERRLDGQRFAAETNKLLRMSRE